MYRSNFRLRNEEVARAVMCLEKRVLVGKRISRRSRVGNQVLLATAEAEEHNRQLNETID